MTSLVRKRRNTTATIVALVGSLVVPLLGADEPESAQVAMARAPEVQAALVELDALLAGKLEEHRLPGMSAVVVCGQEAIWAKGYGYADLENQVPATPETVYDIGSVTKVFTATALMILRDRGVVALDDPAEKYLPEFQVRARPDDAGPITLRQLALHVAGLPQQPDRIRQDVWPSLEDALEALRDDELYAPLFGDRKYSNLGMGILGNALGRAAGRPYTQLVREAVLEPLGMHDTGWTPSDRMQKRLAVGYDPVTEDGTRQRSIDYDPGEGGAPAGGLLTSANDMARFIATYLYEGPADETHILAGSTVRELRQPGWVARGWKFGQGIGWMMWPDGEGRTVVAHGGGRLGFTAKVLLLPELDLGLFVAINERAAIDAVADPALGLLTPAFAAARTRWEETQPPPPLPEGFEVWVGIYEIVPPTEGQQVEIALEDGWLMIFALEKGARAYPARLVPEGGATFRMKGGPFDTEPVVFEREETTGEVRMKVGAFTVVKPLPTKDDCVRGPGSGRGPGPESLRRRPAPLPLAPERQLRPFRRRPPLGPPG